VQFCETVRLKTGLFRIRQIIGPVPAYYVILLLFIFHIFISIGPALVYCFFQGTANILVQAGKAVIKGQGLFFNS